MNARFLVIRLSSLGDIIHTLPAFSALRRDSPKARIVWAVEKKGREILDLVQGIDEVVVIGEPAWLKKIRERNQVALDFQGLVKSGLIAFLSGAETRIGFSRKNLKEWLATVFYTDQIQEVSEEEHVISKNLKLLSKVGIEDGRYDFSLVIPDEILDSVRRKIAAAGISGHKRFIVFNVGAGWETKRWPAEAWTKLLKMVGAGTHERLLLWGNEEERKLALAVSEDSQIPLAPFLTVKEVTALLKQAALLVSGDTFALQVACALKTPVVGIFGPTDPGRNGPFSPADRVASHRRDCAFCYKKRCSDPACMREVTPEEVAALISRRLG